MIMAGSIQFHPRSGFHGWQQQNRSWKTAVATTMPFPIQLVIKLLIVVIFIFFLLATASG
jgi:hypothetical protein